MKSNLLRDFRFCDSIIYILNKNGQKIKYVKFNFFILFFYPSEGYPGQTDRHQLMFSLLPPNPPPPIKGRCLSNSVNIYDEPTF